jgi:hypothetical protein
MVTFSGDLTGAANPAGQTVLISGAAAGSTSTDGAGHFSVTLLGKKLGQVFAQIANGLSNVAQIANGLSNVAQLTLTNKAPVISQFSAGEAPGDIWTFFGKVTDESPAGLPLVLGGLASLPNVTVQVRPDGCFSYSVMLNGTGSDNGCATADVTDWWGAAAATADYYITQS